MEPADESLLESLATAVSRQVDALAHLRFKFEVQQLLLAGGRAMYVDETTRELQEAIDRVQICDASFREALGLVAARTLGLSPEATLREVAAAAPEPWCYIFTQGREELRTGIGRVGQLCEENRKLLARGFLATSEALAMLGVATGGISYDATGSPVRAPASAAIINMKA